MNILDELDQLEKTATPGPWEHDGKAAVHVGQSGMPYWETFKSNYVDGKYELDYCADGKLIATMRNALPALIECARLVELCHKYIGNSDCLDCDPEVNWHTPECCIGKEASKLMALLKGGE